MSSHASRVVLVSGAGRGIGRAMADAHADAGAAVAYLDHDPDLARTAAEAARARGVNAVAVSADVADFDAVAAAVAEAAAALGPIDVLVNNAGISPKTGADNRRVDAFAMDPAEWRRVIDVNLTGAFNCTRSVLPGMRDLGRGRVVNISSVAGRTYCDIVAVHYAASKAALVGFTKHLAGELGPFGITVNALAPGRIDTPLMRGTAPEANEAVRAVTPLRRLGSPEEVASVCLFLTSDAAAFVTGQVCDVAGGWLMT
ncbi:SDR family oxidoreductase [Azorhizobium doebereinerae]|uniref:SDR family oxidoreductase n=1 Tax=Azorhizobium doebereinerae TaxID=281091 RepID=UPI000429BB22|nr:SDR family NAD(P)-dependent oxidoreductase [Azorhizobium doebereinerae]